MAMWDSASTSRAEPVSHSQRRDEPWVPVIVLAAFLVRLWAAWGTFLNPDEALHFLIANKTSWAAAYKASLSTAHPPGLIFVLYFWRILGTSEVVLRLPSVIAGTAFCWLFFWWLRNTFHRNAAWVGFLLVSFLPPVVGLSAEVRQYALMLLCMAGAMYLFEEALADKSAFTMLASGLSTCLALCFHYSALLFAAAFGIYGLLKIAKLRLRAGVAASWAAGQVLIVALFAFFYWHHIAKLSANPMAEQTMESWLANSYFHPGKQNVLLFAFARTFGVFQFVFGQLAVGDIAGLLFIVGIILLCRWRAAAAVLLMALSFAIAGGLAIAGKYPYGGTRHSAFLIPFAVTGVSLAIDFLAKEKLRIGIVVALCTVILSAAFGAPHRPYMTRADQSSTNMREAVAFIAEHIGPGQTVIVDYQTSLLLGHYLCQQSPMKFNTSFPGFEQFQCDAVRVISTGPQLQIFHAASFQDPKLWAGLADHFGVGRGSAVWIVQAGWDIGLAQELRDKALDAKSFGKNIQVFRFEAL